MQYSGRADRVCLLDVGGVTALKVQLNVAILSRRLVGNWATVGCKVARSIPMISTEMEVAYERSDAE